MANQTPEELEAIEANVQLRLGREKVQTFVFTLFFVGYVWLCFEGELLNEFGGVLKIVLPSFFATWNAIGISVGVGLLIAHRAVHGFSWFDSYHLDAESRILNPHRGILCGSIFFLIILNSMIAGFWVIMNIANFDISLWISIPLFAIVSTLWAFVAEKIGRVLGIVLKAKVF
jgi:hypothetical protein